MRRVPYRSTTKPISGPPSRSTIGTKLMPEKMTVDDHPNDLAKVCEKMPSE